MLGNYNTAAAATIEGELAASRTNTLEYGMMHGLYTVEGFGLMGDPENEIEAFVPLIIEGMSEDRRVGSTYDYNPEGLCFELYGTHDLAYLLMRINGCAVRADFVGPIVKVVRPGLEAELIRIHEVARARAAVKREAAELLVDITLQEVSNA